MKSVILDYGKGILPDAWSSSSFRDYKDLLEKVEILDKELGEPDCEDPDKTPWMKEIEERLAQVERLVP